MSFWKVIPSGFLFFFFYFFDFLELMEEVLVCWRWPEVWGWMWEVMVVVWTLVKVLI